MKKNDFPYHLLAVAIFPPLFLFARNLEYVQPQDLIRPIAGSLVVIIALCGVLSALLRSVQRAAVLTTMLWTAFSMYGHLYQVFRATPALASALGRHSVLGPLFFLLVAALAWRILRARQTYIIALFMNAILGVLVALMVFNAGFGYWNASQSHQAKPSATARAPMQLTTIDPANRPDIYYIILDTYARADVIQDKFELDTSGFLQALRSKGFYIASDSHANYDFTRVSLASSLNMNFIQDLDARFTPDNANNAILDDYILHSKVRASLESIGYRTVAFATGFTYTEMTDADLYLSPARPSLLAADIQPFESLWLKTTALRALFDTHPVFLSGVLGWLSFPHQAHVERELFLLDQIARLPETPGPKFVFAHVLIPHVPLVFRSDGSITRDDRYFRETFDQPASEEYLLDGYRNQVEYINHRILSIVDAILKKSVHPPVIIIQGDHGSLYFNPFPILNAYYLPESCDKVLYPGITPVNSFRAVFNACFDANLPLLPDQAFSSPYTRPYDFKPVEVPPSSKN